MTLLTSPQHQPGQMVGNDAVPEFNAQTLPPGSAPADRTFKPNNASDIPPVANYRNDNEADSGTASASSTLGGATSGDVNTGLGKPIQGQSSAEMHHDGQAHRKNPGMGGAEGVGGTAQNAKLVDPHVPEMAGQRALDKDEAKIGRGDLGANAEDRLPEGSETVARENKLPRN